MNNSNPRFNIYGPIHKALRAMMADALVQLGRTDWQDPVDRGQATAVISQLLDFCVAHLEHENDFVHAAMEARRPGSAADGYAEHRMHVNAIRDLREQVTALSELAPADCIRVGEALYRSLAAFVGENYEHMHFEETHNNSVLWAHYTDEEIVAIEHAIIASIEPHENAIVMRWMLPHVSPQERAVMLSGMRQNAPAEVFHGVLGMLRVHLTPRDWNKLSEALGFGEPALAAAA